MFTAYYMPALPPQTKDPSKDGFTTREEAWAYVLSKICKDCRKEEESGEPSACGCEWMIGETSKLDAANNFEDLMEAGGWKTVYRKPE